MDTKTDHNSAVNEHTLIELAYVSSTIDVMITTANATMARCKLVMGRLMSALISL